MDHTPRPRRALATALALLLAFESLSAVAVAAAASVDARVPHGLPAAVPQGLVLAETGASGATGGATGAGGGAATPDAATVDEVGHGGTGPVRSGVPETTVPDRPARASLPDRPARIETAPVGGAAPRTARASTAGAADSRTGARAVIYAGRNHVWIPSLRIDRSVAAFPCARSRPPDNLVYRWGCAGANNVYLLGHAYSVFKPLHDAYVAGRLKVGMKAWYADGRGRVGAYAVAWWKVTRPTTDARWAWAAQSRRSMTLQTCVGANSAYRLIVRLVEVSR